MYFFVQKGVDIAYVVDESRDSAWEKALQTLIKQVDLAAKLDVAGNLAPLGRTFRRLFINGASGSGKSRMGVELFKALVQLLTARGLVARYAGLEATKLPGPAIGAALARAFRADTLQHSVPMEMVEDMAKSILDIELDSAGPKRLRGIIVLHIDEFAKDESTINIRG